MIETKSQKSAVPIWVTVPIVIAAIAAGGWILWRFWHSQVDTTEVVQLDQPIQANNGGNAGPGIGPRQPRINQPPPPPQFPPPNLGTGRTAIKAVPNGWAIRGKEMSVRIAQKGPDFVFHYYYPAQQNQAGADEIWTHRDRIMQVASLNLSAAQRSQLTQLIYPPLEVPLTDDERKRIEGGWNAVIAGADEKAKSEAEKKLLADVNEISVREARKLPEIIAGRVTAIKNVLGPDAVTKFHQVLSPPKPKPTPVEAAPATAPSTQGT